MKFIEKRSDEPNKIPTLMPRFDVLFKGNWLPSEIEDVLYDKEELQRVLAKKYGDGHYMVLDIGGRGHIKVQFKGQCSSFF